MVGSQDALPRLSVSAETARNLSTATVTPIQNAENTPRWLHRLLPWVDISGGVYRVNKRNARLVTAKHVVVQQSGDTFTVQAQSLRTLPAFSDLSDDHLDALASRFKVERRKAGEVIAESDSAPNKLFVVADGTVELATDGPHNTRLRKALLGTGGYFGDEALLGAPYRLPTARPLSDAVLLVLDLGKLDKTDGLREGITRSLERRRILLDEVNEFGETRIDLLSGHVGEPKLPTTFVDFAEYSREYHLSTIQTILQTHTRITDLYSNEIDQLREQVRVTIDAVKEREEWDIINNPDFGLLHEVAPGQRIPTRSGPPTPDDLDELLTKVWKKPAFFLAHPKAIAAFGREATRRGVPPVVIHLFGSPFLTWRGVPLVPTNKLPIKGGANGEPATTSILLLRVGEAEQGVVGLQKVGVTGEVEPGLSVRYMGTNEYSIASHLVTRYFSAAVLVDDAIARLDNVLIERYHDYSA